MFLPSEGQSRAQAQIEATGSNLDDDLHELEADLIEDLADDLDDTISLDAQTTTANSTGLTMAELDELLSDDDEELDSLDALLGESVELAQDAKRAKSIKQRIRTGQASAKEIADLQAWEAKAHWLPTAKVEVWDRYTCRCCGEVRHMFSDFMQEYQGIGNTGNLRYQRINETEAGGEKPKLIVRAHEVKFCDSCPGLSYQAFDAPATIWKE